MAAIEVSKILSLLYNTYLLYASWKFRHSNGEKLPETEEEMAVAQEEDPRVRDIANKMCVIFISIALFLYVTIVVWLLLQDSGKS